METGKIAKTKTENLDCWLKLKLQNIHNLNNTGQRKFYFCVRVFWTGD